MAHANIRISDKRPDAASHAHERLLALSAVAAEMGACESQHDLFHIVGRRLHELGLESIILMLTPDGRRLRMTYVNAEDFWPESLAQMESLLGQPWHTVEFARDVPCALTAVVDDGQLRLSPSMLDDMQALWPDFMAARRETVAQLFPAWRAIYAPLRSAGEIVGLIAVFAESLQEADAAVLDAFANILSAMLESVRRLEAERRRNQQLQLLQDLTEEITAAAPNVPALLRTVTEGLTSEPRYARAGVGLLHAGDLLFDAGAPDRTLRLPLNAANHLARVARTGEPLHLDDAATQRGGLYAPLAAETRSLLVIPLRGGVEREEVAGVLYVENDAPHAFDAHDQAALQTLAGALVTALHNARLYEYMESQLARRLREQALLLQIGQAVTESLDAHAVLDRVLALATNALNAERGWISLIEAETDEIVVRNIVGIAGEGIVGHRTPLAGSFTEWLIEHEPVACIPDTGVEGWYTPIFAGWPTGIVPRSALIMLLTRRGQPIGALAMHNKKVGRFDDEDMQLARAIGQWVTLALDNAALYQDSQDKKQAVERSMARLSAALIGRHDLRATLDLIIDLAAQLAGADAGFATLFDPASGETRIYAVHNLPPELREVHYPTRPSLDGAAMDAGGPIVLDDALENPLLVDREKAEAIQVRSTAGAPMIGAHGPLGSLVVFRRQVRPFQPEDVSLLMTFTQQAAVAVERAQLAELARERAAFLEAILENAREGVIVINGEEVEYANPTARRHFSALPARGGSIKAVERHLISPAEHQYARQMWARFMAGGTFPFELDVVDDQGERRRLRINPSLLSPPSRYIIIIDDVTDEYTLERRRYEFLREVHHGLRTPLTSVLLALESALSADLVSEERRGETLRLVYQLANVMRARLDEMHMYTFLGEPIARPLDRRADTRQIVLLALVEARRAHPGITFQERLPAKLPAIACEQNSIYRAVHHLLENAAKFSREAGVVEVRANVQDSVVRLSIRDEGIGIAPDRLKEIFEPFHQLDDRVERQYPGVGLGLSLVRRAVQYAGGTIEVQSAPGQGSTFTLILPIAPKE